MGTVDLSSYKKLYLETAEEYCNMLSSNYVKLSVNGFDKDALKNMYISAHSLQSESQVMGYLKIGELSGMIEKITKNILATNTQVSDDLMAVIKDAIDSIQESLLQIETDNKEKDTDTITNSIK